MATASSTIGTSLCRRCRALVQLTDRFCRHCGQSTASDFDATGVELVAAPTCGEPACREVPCQHVRWCDRRWFVLVMLFLVLGPLALPMLWSSRSFSPLAKTLLTAVGLIVTVLAIFASYLPIKEVVSGQ